MPSTAKLERSKPSRFYLTSAVGIFVGLIVALALAVALRVHYRNQPPASHEVLRVVSPDGRSTATVSEEPGPVGKTAFVYDVMLTANGETHTVAHLDGAMRNDRAYGLSVRWAGDGELDVIYLRAQHTQVLEESVPVGAGKVSIVLKSGILDANAPAGGMLYNLQESQGSVI
ncbi:hypothetical protein [Silvibacterium sp.]|uniref:hypothetical protein n=1 Tax=Silvibacterium sp. TaxID=1964179 RepID=UPI0039E64668